MMDKRMVGKWYKEQMGETLNIFDETPIRIKMSFSSSGYYNFEPNCVYEKDGELCYEIKDEKNKMVYHIHFNGDKLIGYYIQFGKKTVVEYQHISNIPDDLPAEYKPTEIYVPCTDKTRLEILREYASYSETKENDVVFEYSLDDKIPDILEKYDYSKYVSKCGADKNNIVFSMLDFVCDHFGHDGCGGMGNGRKAKDIIEFCESHNMKTNCRGLAILLASLLRMNGIRATHIICKPYEEPFNDCHVVVDCFLPSGVRVMLDPTYRLFLHDVNGQYVSLPHLRNILINGEQYTANINASYNGGNFDIQEQREYMTKNTFRFSRGVIAKDGFDERSSRRIELVPQNYPTDNFKEEDKAEFVYNEAEFWGEL